MKGGYKIKVAIADDQAIFRNGLAHLLIDQGNIEVVFQSANGKELIDNLGKQMVDLAIVDYRMPEMNGISAVKVLRKKYPSLRILMLSMYNDEELVQSSIRSGANGFISKDDDPEEIFRAITSVLSIGYYINDRTSSQIVKSMMLAGDIIPEFEKPIENIHLTESEIIVIRLMSKELSTRDIAKKMFRSERTIESHRASIMAKTGATNAIGIIIFAVKAKIIEI